MSGTTPDKYFIIGDSTSLGASKRFYINGTTGHVGINEISKANDALRVNGHLNTNSLSVTSGNTILEENLTVKEHTILKKNLTVIGDASFNAITLSKSDNTTDINAKLGNGIFGFSGTSDNMGIQHESLVVNGNNYAVKQNSSGETSINAASNQRILFCNSNNTKMTIKNTGEVGIGTEDPSGDLHIYGNTASHGSAMIEGIGKNYSAFLDLKNTEYSKNNSGETGGHYRLKSYGGEARVTGSNGDRNGDFAIQQLPYGSTSSADIVERFTISNAGNVGIGTDSPAYNLDLTNAKQIRAARLNLYSSTYWVGTNNSQLALYGGNVNGIGLYTSSAGSGLGNEAMRIRNNGKVGIGTTAPPVKLSVNSSNTTPSSSGNIAGSFALHNSTNGASLAFGVDSHSTTSTSSLSWIQSAYVNDSAAATNLAFYTGKDERMRITHDGKVGIGTDSPSEMLHVNGNIELGIAARIKSYNATSLTIQACGNSNVGAGEGLILKNEYTSTAGNKSHLHNIKIGRFSVDGMEFNTNNTTRMVINSSGNVGIGTTSPDEKLCVNGTVKLVKGLTIERNSSTFDDSTIDNRQWCIDMDTLDDDGIGVLDDLRFRYKSSDVDATGAKVWGEERTAMTLHHDGLLGIGTDLPAAKLDVYGDFMVHEQGSGIKFIPSAYNNSSNTNIEFIANHPIDASDYISEINSHTDTTSTATTTDHSHLQITGGNSKEKSIIITTGNEIRNIQGWNSSQLETTTVSGTGTGNTSENISLQAMGGNVGIGTTSPLYKLHIDCGSALSTNGVFIRNQLVNNNQVTFLRLGIGSENYAQISAHTLAGDKTYLQFHTQSGDGTVSGNISERMRIDENGNVGIGTTSPNYTLDVDGSLNCTELRIGGTSLTNDDNRIDASTIAGGAVTDAQFGHLSGVTDNIQTQLDDRALKTDIPDVSGYLTNSSRVINGDASSSSNRSEGNVYIRTAVDGRNSNTGGYSQARTFFWHRFHRYASNTGNPNLITTFQQNQAGIFSHSNNDNNGTYVNFDLNNGSFRSNNTTNLSDDRLKWDETDISNALITIMKLKPQYYTKYGTYNVEDPTIRPTYEDVGPGIKEYGFIAQDVDEIEELKCAVEEERNNFDDGRPPTMGLNYTDIFTVAVKAIQELKEEVDTLKARITELENK